MVAPGRRHVIHRERQRRKDMEAHWAFIEQMAEQRALQLGLDASLVKALHDGAYTRRAQLNHGRERIAHVLNGRCCL